MAKLNFFNNAFRRAWTSGLTAAYEQPFASLTTASSNAADGTVTIQYVYNPGEDPSAKAIAAARAVLFPHERR